MNRERPDRVVARFVLVTLVLPAVVTLAGLIIQLSNLPSSSARIHIYWDGAGTPLGAAPGALPLALTVALGFGLPAVFGLGSLPSLRRGERSPGFRLFGAQALGLSVLLNVAATCLVLQVNGTTPTHRSLLWLPLCIGLVAGGAAAVAGWFLQPRSARPAAQRAVAPLEVAPSEVLAWMHMTFLPIPAVVVIGAATVLAALRAGFEWAAGDRDGLAVILTVVTLLLMGLAATSVAFRVRVDTRGFSVRSVLGVPRFRVTPDEVGSVAVVDARSLGVRGSWGIRIFPGRVTVVMRSTTGIRVTRRDGRVFFVTVDDAATGAALLDALAAQSNGTMAEPSADDGRQAR